MTIEDALAILKGEPMPYPIPQAHHLQSTAGEIQPVIQQSLDKVEAKILW